MIRTGTRNLITDVTGLTVGNAEDSTVRTGVTVLLCDAPCKASVDIRGGAPGSREIDVLAPDNLVGAADALVLSGGSVFGLDAASGVVAGLAAMGRGFEVAPGAPRAPIVPEVILFDLINGGDKNWDTPPYARLGREALLHAGKDFALGNAGAGYGAIAGAYKGGLGSASAISESGFTIGALVAVNSVGSPIIPGTDAFWAWPFEMNDEFGGKMPEKKPEHLSALPKDMKGMIRPEGNTTIAILATDADLSQAELKRLAIMAADGFARALRPSHSPFDGDSIFTVSTGKRLVAEPRAVNLLELGSLAADVMARAIARGVYEAETLPPVKSYREVFAG